MLIFHQQNAIFELKVSSMLECMYFIITKCNVTWSLDNISAIPHQISGIIFMIPLVFFHFIQSTKRQKREQNNKIQSFIGLSRGL